MICRFLFQFVVGMISLDRNYREVINLLFVLPRLPLNVFKTEKMLQVGTKKKKKTLDVRGTSFQRKRLKTKSDCEATRSVEKIGEKNERMKEISRFAEKEKRQYVYDTNLSTQFPLRLFAVEKNVSNETYLLFRG